MSNIPPPPPSTSIPSQPPKPGKVKTTGTQKLIIVLGSIAGLIYFGATSGTDDSPTASTTVETSVSEPDITEPDATPTDADQPADPEPASETPAITSEPAPTTTDAPAQPAATRDTPASAGEHLLFTVSTFGDADGSVWDIAVTGPGEDITDATLTENMFNEPPADGNIFYGIPVSLTLVDAGKEPLAPWLNITWDAFGPASLQIFDTINASCGVIPNAVDEMTEIFIGGTLSGMLCFELPAADVDAGPLLSSDVANGRIYLATDTPAAPVEPSVHTGETFLPDGSGNPGTRTNPTPLNSATSLTVSTFGDADGSVWDIAVTGPGEDITDATLTENMFNEPPADGNIFYGIPVSLTLVDAGKEPLAPWLNITWDAFGPASLQIFDTINASCGVIPNAVDEMTEIFIGGTLSGMLCFELPAADVDAGPLLSSDVANGRIYLATQ